MAHDEARDHCESLLKFFIDTSVFMYAARSEHEFKESSVRVIEQLRSGDIEGYTSTEVVQEILHRYLSINKRKLAYALAGDVLDAMSPLLPISEVVMTGTIKLAERYPKAQARDLVHLATCIESGITSVVTHDQDFKSFQEITTIDPRQI